MGAGDISVTNIYTRMDADGHRSERNVTIDPKIHALAAAWCQGAGWHNTVDVERLAVKIQEVVEEFEAELENELEER